MECTGHPGLAKSYYDHLQSASPGQGGLSGSIRRMPDMMSHWSASVEEQEQPCLPSLLAMKAVTARPEDQVGLRRARRLRLGRLASCQSADTSGNLGQVVVELVIAAVEPMHDRAGYRSLIKIDMRKRRSVVLLP